MSTVQACHDNGDWSCSEHGGWICDLDHGHDGPHRCVRCPKPMKPGWSNAAKARVGQIDASEAAMRAEVETSPDI